ncbi:MAG: response regulator [candidate division NC10 bacterium]|nr:response regulator [candidate division NC10 bacterium]MBI2163094.1 response regulator [candidate division NC10 bacterium]MBI2456286.1 response regulator [candidate division NC10 bacterium]MBI2562392.1 response regulator [candidate division NC10 bacterium]
MSCPGAAAPPTMAKILVVDDEALLRAMLQDALEEAGYAVVVADNGRAGIASAKADRPDCILLDVMMPGLDGYETCAAIKADPDLAAIPVVLISATTDLRVIDRAEKVGAAEVLPKPVPMEQLQQALAIALNPPQA